MRQVVLNLIVDGYSTKEESEIYQILKTTVYTIVRTGVETRPRGGKNKQKISDEVVEYIFQ